LGTLLSGNYSVCYADNGHLLDGVFLAYIYQQFGKEGISAFRRRAVCGVHPSQMIKAGGIDKDPSVYVLPYIFGTIKTKEPGCEMIWPEEGAPIIPVLISQKKDASENERSVAEFLCGETCGRTFITQGLFPSSHPGVFNKLPGKLLWLGWDYIYQNDLLRIIARAKTLFLDGER
jgi:ABC-type Fe3+ transport system substrate-binding protein